MLQLMSQKAPGPPGDAASLNFKKAQPSENKPLLYSPAPLISGSSYLCECG